MKLKTAWWMVLLMVGAAGGRALAQDGWSRSYGGNGQGWAGSVAACPGGGYLVGGEIASQGSEERSAWLFKTDGEGRLLWERSFSAPDDILGAEVCPGPEGGGYFVGTTGQNHWTAGKGFVMRFDASGARFWHRKFPETSEYASLASVCPAPDGGCVTAGSIMPSQVFRNAAWVTRLDPEGRVVWSRRFGSVEEDDAAQCVRPAEGGGYFVAMVVGMNSPGGRRAQLVKLDESGQVLWQRRYGIPHESSNPCVAPTPGGGCVMLYSEYDPLFGGLYRIIKVGSAGETLWHRAITSVQRERAIGGPAGFTQANDGVLPPVYNMQSFSLCPSPAGGIVAALVTAGLSVSLLVVDTYVMEMDPSGEVLWQSQLGEPGADGLASIAPGEGGGYVLAGSTLAYGQGELNAWVVKIGEGGPPAGACAYIHPWASALQTLYLAQESVETAWSDAPMAGLHCPIAGGNPGSGTARQCPREACLLSCDASAAPGGGPLEFAFRAQTDAANCEGSPEYLWSFGDGATSRDPEPVHAYPNAGVYRYSLIVSADGTSLRVEGTVTAGAPECRLFCRGAASPEAGLAPLHVRFFGGASQDSCLSSPAYAWNFGDGATSAERDPVHRYVAPGEYTWTLTVLSGAGACTRSGVVGVAGQMVGSWAHAYQYSEQFRVGSSRGVEAMPLPGGGYLALGTVQRPWSGDSSMCQLLEVDPMGVPRWESLYAGSGIDEARSLDLAAGGGSFIAGESTRNEGYETEPWVLKVDGQGTPLWRKVLGTVSVREHLAQVRATADGGCVGVGSVDLGRPFVVRFGAAGDLLWIKSYAKKVGTEEYSCILPLSDGGYLVGGRGVAGGGSKIFLMRMDPTGNAQWKWGYSSKYKDRIASVVPLPDGGFAAAGFAEKKADVPTTRALRVDSGGRLLWTYLYEFSTPSHALGILPWGTDGLLLSGATGPGETADAPGSAFLMELDLGGAVRQARLLSQETAITGARSHLAPAGGVVLCTRCPGEGGGDHTCLVRAGADLGLGTDCPGLTLAPTLLVKPKPKATKIAIKAADAPIPAGEATTKLMSGLMALDDALCSSHCTLACRPQASVTSGAPPLEVLFRSSISSSACSRSASLFWDFGDGSTSREADPIHIYSAPGTYRWQLTAAAEGFSCSGEGTVRVGSTGAPMWEHIIHGWQWGGCARLLPGGDTVAAAVLTDPLTHASRPLLVRLDGGGNLLWSRVPTGDVPARASWVEPCPDGGFVVAGTFDSNSSFPVTRPAWALRLDPGGNVLWSRRYGGSGTGTFTKVRAAADGSLFFLGTHGRPWVLKTDAGGEILWQRLLGYSGTDSLQDLAVTSDGGCAVAGKRSGTTPRGLLARFDPTGWLLWERTYAVTNQQALEAVRWLPDGTLAASGVAGSLSSNGKGWVLWLTGGGEVLWSKTYYLGQGSTLSGIFPLVGGGFGAFARTEREGHFLILGAGGDVVQCYQLGDTQIYGLSLDVGEDGGLVFIGAKSPCSGCDSRPWIAGLPAGWEFGAGCGLVTPCAVQTASPNMQVGLPFLPWSGAEDGEEPIQLSLREYSSLSSSLCAADPCVIQCRADVARDDLDPSSAWFQVSVEQAFCFGGPEVAWDCGDGSLEAGASVNHRYAAPGTYPWTLSVVLGGARCSQSGSVTVGP